MGHRCSVNCNIAILITPLQLSGYSDETAIAYAILIVFPSFLLLLYLAMRATEGWQLLVVGAFCSCFVASWLMRSKAMLGAGYAMTIALATWVFLVNR